MLKCIIISMNAVARASVVWLNYNSMRFIDIALESLNSFLSLDFDGYELIVVDNASTDGSFERIRRFIEEHKPSGVRVRVIRNERNLGYAGGMNVGWEARDPDSRYVAFVNNDLIPTPQSLTKLIEHVEGNEGGVAAVSGLIYYGDGRIIYSAGGWGGDELWFFDDICNGFVIDECPGINKEHHVTYSDGAYMVVRVDAVRRTMPNGKPFIDETFLYLDDVLLGLVLWNKGYKSMYIPINAGLHFTSMTTRGPLISRYVIRSFTALSIIVETKYSNTTKHLLMIRRSIGNKILCLFKDDFCLKYYGYIDGIRLGNYLRSVLGTLNLYKAPYVKVSIYDLIKEALMVRGRVKVTHNMLVNS